VLSSFSSKNMKTNLKSSRQSSQGSRRPSPTAKFKWDARPTYETPVSGPNFE
ncbi:unnamed protein product, partial [Sphenostylis stenocarpa]